MLISIPLTGTLISYNPIVGDPDDPVRPIDIDLGNVSCQLISLDLESDLALIEVTPAEEGDFPTEEVDEEDNPIYKRRKLTDTEKKQLLDAVRDKLLDKKIDDLYKETKSAKLKKPRKR